MSMTESWTVRHFSQAMQGDVPGLLRLVAQSIEDLGNVTIQDITFGTEITADEPWYDLTVYFHDDDDGSS